MLRWQAPPGPRARPASLRADPDPEPVERHRADEQRAPGDVLPERIDPGEREPVVEDPDDQEPDRCPDDRPPTAAQARAAEDDRRDHGQLHAYPEEAGSDAELRGQDEPAQRPRGGGDEEGDEDVATGPDPHEASRR